MELNEISYSGQPPIDAYGPGYFRVAGKMYDGALLILPAGLVSWAGLDDDKPLLNSAGLVDILFVGTGQEISHLPVALRTVLDTADVPYEVMSSPSACRTYNVLLSEGRRVGLAVLPV